MASTTLTDQNFDAEIVGPETIVLVICYDEYFSNRYLIEREIAKLVDQYNRQVKFCYIRMRENPITAERFRIFISPTLLFFKNGKLVESLTGTFPRIEIKKIIWKLYAEKNESDCLPV